MTKKEKKGFVCPHCSLITGRVSVDFINQHLSTHIHQIPKSPKHEEKVLGDIEHIDCYHKNQTCEGCKETKPTVKEVRVKEIRKKLYISSDFTARLNKFRGLSANAVYNLALEDFEEELLKVLNSR